MKSVNKITIASDSFKGSLSSMEVADSIEAGVKQLFPRCEVQKVKIADGGEGLIDALISTIDGQCCSQRVQDPLGRPVDASFALVDDGRTAVIESAAACGLPFLSSDERNPMLTSTFGVGELILRAIRSYGCRKILLGIGGSATNDAGMGMFEALGFKFLDHEGNILKGRGEALAQLAEVDRSSVAAELEAVEIWVACDVTNPFFGKEGAAYVFAPQKGADAEMVVCLDNGLRNFAQVVKRCFGTDISTMPGAGAAGGMGGGLKALLNAKLLPGIDLVLDAMHFDSIIEGSDLIFTGEGKIDRQTLMGKAPSGVLRYAHAQSIPVVAMCGTVDYCPELTDSGFSAIFPISDRAISLEEAMKKETASKNVTRATIQAMKLLLTD